MKFGEWKPQKGFLPALSVRQPFAWLIAHQSEYPNGKDIENREWATSYRGPLLIHAGKEVDHNFFQKDDLYFPYALKRTHPELERLMPQTHKGCETGGIVGICEIVDCIAESVSPWFIGKYGFVLANARTLPFVAYRGALGLFSVPESILQGIDETTLRAQNIPHLPPPELDNAYALTQAIAQAEAAKAKPKVDLSRYWSPDADKATLREEVKPRAWEKGR